ncbi:MAG: hypothetical protein ACRC0S_02930 [Fusobacteriaceae bacterium]
MLEIFSNIYKRLFLKKEIEEETKEDIKRREELIKTNAKELRDRCIKITGIDKEKNEKKSFSSSKLTKEDITKWCEVLLKEGKEDVLLSKNGKRLNGIALTNRIAKYLEVEGRGII